MLNISPVLNEWLQLFVFSLVGVSMFFLGARLSRYDRKLINIISAVGVILAVIAGATNYQPFRSVFGAAASHIGGEAVLASYALLLLVGIGREKMKKLMLNVAVGLAFSIVLLHSCSPLYWHYFGKQLYNNYPNKKGIIQQTTGITCAPASASMLLNHYDIKISEGFLAELAGTNIIGGTDEYSLAKALEYAAADHGLKAQAGHLNYKEALALHKPFIAYVLMPSIGGHAILVTLLKPDSAIISDPLSGVSEKISMGDFKQKWLGTAIWITKCR